MNSRLLDLLAETISKNEIVPVIGAGIHAINAKEEDLAFEWGRARKNLHQWDGILFEAARRIDLEVDGVMNPNISPTIKWEMIINLIPGNGSARQKEKKFIDVIQDVAKKAELDVLDKLTPYHPLMNILQHPKVNNIISLNIEFIIEHLLSYDYHVMAHSGTKGLDRKTRVGDKVVWHPHGDYRNKKTITFGLRQYSQTINELERARIRFKQYERAQKEPEITNWIDLFMSKPLLFLATSINPAEWDIWFALVNRWRNFGKDKFRDKEPKVFVLAKNGEAHHIPEDKFNIIRCKTYPEGWDMLQSVFYN